MSHGRQDATPLGSAVSVLALCLFSPSARAQEGRSLTDAELGPLAASLAAQIEARSSGIGLPEARTALIKSLAGLRVALEGADPLGRPADLARATWLSRGYEREGPKTGKVVSEPMEDGGSLTSGVGLAYRLPKGYDPARAAYPLILAIPNEGQKPAEHLRADWTSRELMEGAILVCPEMPAEQGEWTQVMVNGRPGGLCHVLAALRMAGERFALDFDRVYVAGRGKGVPAAFAAGNYAPQRFAGVIGRSGDLGQADPVAPENFGNLPSYFAGGGANARSFQEAVRAAGADNCVLQPAGTEEDVWNWVREHPRRTYPERVTVVPGDPFPTRAYWLRIAPTATDARATAVLDRAANAIRIDGNGVARATLYLNDALVDLDRPVLVSCNGVETTARVQRGLSTTLDLLQEGTSDPACVYVAEARFDMTGEALAASAEVEAEGARQRELRKVLRLDPDNDAAHAALGHVRDGERWFSSAEALERYQRSQDPETAAAKGYVEHKSVWMHPDERALASKGWEKDPETGLWLTPSDRKRLAEGWVRQDLEWIPPEQAAKVDDGLWFVDGEWLELEAANRRHSRVDSMWRIPSARVLLHSTADRDVSLRAMHHMDRAVDDLRRVFVAEPVLPLPVALLRSEEQYDRFAFGDPDGSRAPTHAGRLHVIHSAFFAESWFPRVDGKLQFAGMGVCYWDALVPYGDLYGVHSARLAVGLSYVDALDPSPKAVRAALKDGPDGDHYEAYGAEKRLPAWLRCGGAVYAERYFRDTSVDEGGDPWWARSWSLENLRARGGLRDLDEVFAFRLDPEDREDGLRRLIEAGLVVSFIVDGGCEPVSEAHSELGRALVSGRLHPNHVEALEGAVLAHEAELRAYAGQ